MYLDHNELMRAVRLQNMKLVKEIVENQTCANYALYYAVYFQHTPFIEELLSWSEIKTNVRDDNHHSPLTFACESPYPKQIEIVNILLKHGCEDRDRNAALQTAVRHGNLELVKTLIDAGTDVLMRDYKSNTLLRLAVSVNSSDVSLYLIRLVRDTKDIHSVVQFLNQRDEEKKYYTPLDMAIELQNETIIKELLKNGTDEIDVNNNENYVLDTPLHIALDTRNIKIMQMLVEANADVNILAQQKETVLFRMAKSRATGNNIEIICFLLNTGRCKQEYPSTNNILSKFIENYPDQRDTLKLMLEKLIGVEHVLGAALQTVVKSKNSEDLMLKILETLTDHTCELEDINKALITNASIRGERHRRWIMNTLIDAGGEICVQDGEGRSLLFFAIMNMQYEMATELIEDLVDSDVKDFLDIQTHEGKTHIWLASEIGDYVIVDILANHGCDVNKCDNSGFTPLWIACLNGNITTVETLIKYNCNVNIEINGSSIVDYLVQVCLHGFTISSDEYYDAGPIHEQSQYRNCELRDHPSMITMLLDAGCRVSEPTYVIAENAGSNIAIVFRNHRNSLNTLALYIPLLSICNPHAAHNVTEPCPIRILPIDILLHIHSHLFEEIAPESESEESDTETDSNDPADD